jgi:hypothetical protein
LWSATPSTLRVAGTRDYTQTTTPSEFFEHCV